MRQHGYARESVIDASRRAVPDGVPRLPFSRWFLSQIPRDLRGPRAVSLPSGDLAALDRALFFRRYGKPRVETRRGTALLARPAHRARRACDERRYGYRPAA